ncbi:hypothetical protein NECAME_07432 [Necator americanus]|uniref:Tudor domain-containing protein n=1 Tax=Necator americanus TaxID=51031 RepID=W2TNS0_NECAM|nr:hypothetical protein NECAME_07432 [Necator americanus]ETN83314.1 hypothetical protein NECAME_07432 [Necator americanus]
MFIGNVPPERPLSPIFTTDFKNPQMCRNGLQEDGVVKINRIPLMRTAVVQILNAESPSCIWVRLTNHITESLTFTEPYDLVQRCESGGINGGNDLKEFEYCLAPIMDRTYGRCRVLEVMDTRVKVFFIDEGVSAWVAKDCLACMPLELAYHPWQAIMVSLCGVGVRHPLRQGKQAKPAWNEKECVSFRRLLSAFPLFKTRTVKSSFVHNDYRKAVQVELYGIPEGYTDTSESVGLCIAALFCGQRRGRLRSQRVANAAEFEPALNIQEENPPRLEDIPLFRRHFPADWKRASAASDQASLNENMIEWRDWTPQIARVPPLEVEWLDNNGYCTLGQQYLMNVEGSQTQSPYEFYARPIRRGRVRVAKTDIDSGDEDQLQSETEAMLNAHDELKKKATILDTFYSLEDNRSPLESNQWHCTYPPLCMQLCMYGVGPCNTDGRLEWSEGAKNEWRKLLREDLPMSMSIVARLNKANDNRVLQSNEPAWKRPGVLFVQFLKVHGDTDTILKKFCSHSRFPHNGVIQEGVPREWD